MKALSLFHRREPRSLAVYFLLVIGSLGCGGRDASVVETGGVDAEPKRVLAKYGLEHNGLALPGDEVCDKNEDGTIKDAIPSGTYQGLLRNARCDQQRYLIMAYVTQALGVECTHCHVPLPGTPDKQDYPVMTDNKRIANWMYKTFIQGLRPVDGKSMMCSSCHTEDHKAVAKILRDPRDADYASEWMHEVMSVEFVEANGTHLRCKSCHGGMAPNTAGWSNRVTRLLRYQDKIVRTDTLAGDNGE